ncbi:NAD-dependent epimerase/dehydratase family protein [Anoxybacteroides tepidamans]|uniref:NAD-dependent epimerase/dehydratase family protein n=1 Tax=Anoxybacteroides tepidamans TaxID=265948 RepID=UPI0004895F00|nr:NAD-dependent epimerase/dehydratase family protein [Anoxybacillus tepidamans]
MNILVTGGAGFIGSHLVSKLLSAGHRVIVIDNFHPYYAKERKRKQFSVLTDGYDICIHEIDLLDSRKVNEVFQLYQFDCVYHLAALPGVPNSLLQPLDYVDYDIKATINVLKAAGDGGVKHVLFASSSSVYGNQGHVPLREEMAIGNVASPYAAAKYGAESFCYAYANIFGYQLTIFRYFTVYGPWGRPDMAVSQFIHRLLRGEEIVVYGTKTARDYTFVSDIVDGMIAALHRSGSNDVFNLGSGNPITMEKLLALLQMHFPAMKIKYAPERIGDVKATWADITKAQQAFGYKPAVTFAEGLARTIEWAKKYDA